MKVYKNMNSVREWRGNDSCFEKGFTKTVVFEVGILNNTFFAEGRSVFEEIKPYFCDVILPIQTEILIGKCSNVIFFISGKITDGARFIKGAVRNVHF